MAEEILGEQIILIELLDQGRLVARVMPEPYHRY